MAIMPAPPLPDERLRRAADLLTPPDVLLDLAQDPDVEVRRCVASNPSAPLEALLELLEECSEQLEVNPALVLHQLSNPDLLSSAPVHLRERWARSKRLRPWVAEAMAQLDPDRDVRQNLARNTRCSPVVLTRLAGDPYEHVRVAVAKNPRCPVPVLASLASDPSEYVRKGVAGRVLTPLSVLTSLASDPSN
ncbi:MAG: hypothetical protein EOO75_17025, partial [Myxococcales bacterium]